MAEDLQIRIPVTLGMENIPEEVKKIQQQLSNNKNTNIKINAILSDDSINNIKNQLQSLFNNKQAINLNVNSNVQSQLSQVNQTVTTQINAINKKAVVAPKVDISQIDLENLKAMSNAFMKAFDIKSLTSETKTELQSLMREFQVATQKQDFSAIAKAQQALQQFAQDYGKQFKNQETITAFNNFKALYHDIANAIGECDVATRQYLGTNKQFKQIFGDTWNNLRNKDVVGVPDDSALWKLGSTLDDILINYRQQILNFLSEINKSFTTISQLDQLDINKLFSSIANISGSSGLVNTAQQIQNIISGFTNLDGKLQITQDLFNQFTANGANTSSLDSTLEKIGSSYTVVDNNAQNAIGTMAQFSSVYNEVANVQKAYAENIKQSIDVENQNTTVTKNSTELAQKKLRAIEEVTKAQEKQNKVLKSSSNFRDYIDSSLMTFSGSENGINEAIQAFKKFGEVSSSSIKYPTMNARGGSSDLIKYFTIEVKSATGELQKFAYTWKNIGDEDNPNFVYMLSNVREADAGIQKLIASQQKYNDKIKALQTSFTSDLQKIRSSWEDVNGGKSVKSDENINNLNQQYIKVEQSIEALKNADEVTMASMKANVVTQIDKLNQMVTQYHNAEKVATQLRAKGFETVKIDTGNNIDKFINSINNSKVPVQAMKTEIDNLTSSFSNLNNIEDQAGKSSALTSILNILDNAKTKFQALQELFKGSGNANWLSINSEQINKIDDMATKTAIYKNYLSNIANEWKGQQLLVGNVAKEMASLQRGITSIKNPAILDKYVVRIQELVTNYQRLKINLDSQVESQNKIYQIQTQISKLSSTDVSNKAYLEQKLHDEEKTLQNLQMQSGTLKNIVSLKEQEAYVTQQVKKAREDATIAQNHQADTQMAKNIKQVSDYATAIEKSIVNLNRLKNSKIFADNSNKSSVQAQIAQIDQFVTKLTQMRETVGTMATVGNTTGKVGTTAFATLVNDMTNLNSQIKTAETSAKDLQTQLKQTNGVDVQKGKIKVLVAQLEAFAVANGKAMKSNKTLTSGMTVSQEWNAMMSKLKSGADNGDIQKITSQFKAMRSEVKALGLEGGTVFQKLWADAQKFARWMGLTMVTASIAREIRGMFKTVAELDTELIDLRKTFKGTSKDLEDFYYSANDVAKQLGVTTKEVISQASSWSRLGFSTKEAATEMSKLSSMFASISPGMDVDTATTGLVSVMKAFKIDVDDVKEGIMSPINEIGNRFATDNNDIISGLSRSSAAMAAMNSTLSETIALFTAGQEVLQDSEKMGNALKSVAMRVRGYDESTEELSDDLVDITGKVIDLTKVASNDYKGVSLFTDETQEHYKSIYDYLVQIADVYDELSEKNQQELLEKLFGKYQAQAGAAILSNIQAAKDVMNVIENESAGSADREMGVIKDSVDYAKNELTETLTGIAQSSITRDFEKTILQSLTRVLDVLGDASSPLNSVLTTISKIFETTSKLVENLGLIPSIIAGISLSKSFKNGGLFRTVNVDTDKFSQKIGILHRSFADIKTDFSTLSKANGFKQNVAHIFNFASKSDIDNFNNYCKAIEQGTTRTQAFNQYIKNTPTVIRKQAIEFTKTKAELDALTKSYASGKITQQEYNSQSGILKDKLASLTSQTQTLTFAQKAATVATNALATAGKMILNIGFSMAISFAISGIIRLINYQKELNEKIKETAEQAKETSNEIVDLYSQYRELSRAIEAIETDSSKKSDLTKVTDDLLEKLGYEKSAVQELVEEYGNLDDAIRNITLQGLKEVQSSLITGLGVAEKDLINVGSWDYWHSNNSFDDQGELARKAFEKLKNAGIEGISLGKDGGVFTLLGDETVDGILENYETLKSAINVLNESFTTEDLKELDLYKSLDTRYDEIKNKVDTYNSAISDLNDNIAQQQILTSLMGKELPSTQEKFDKFKDSLLESAESSEEWSNKFVGGTDSAKEAIISALKNMPEFTAFFKNEIPDATNNAVTAVTSLNDALTKLQELLKDIISGSSTYQSAMQKVSAGTGLTAKEVNELLELDPSLFDKFIKQKDGTWTIDLEALRLSYDTIIVDGGKDAIAEEKKSYQEQFDAVSKEIENLYVQRAEKLKHINGKADLDELNALDKQIEERKKALQGAQDDLNVASFQESLLDYSDADRIRDSFDEVTKQVDSYNDSISTLKKAQETLNEGNSLSYDDMTKLIMLYPQLKNSVIETADGYTFEQSALEDVSKQAYQTRDDYIDSQIDMTKSAIEQAKLRMEEYAHEIALISSAYAYKHAVETGLFKDYASVKDSITAMEELINILNGYKNNVKEPNSSSSKSADKSISDALQNQIDYYTTLLDAIEAVTDKQIDALEKEKNAIDSKIDALNDEKDALKGKNDEQQRELDLIEAQNNLEKAKKQKVFVYKEGEGLVQIQDEKAVKDAQKELDDVKREIKETDIDKQIEVYEKQQEAIDKQIDSANAYKDTFSDMESNAKDQLAIEQAKKALGVDENGLLHIDENTAKNIRNGLAEDIYNKDVNDNKDNDKYVTVSLADYLSGLGATVTPQQFQAIANTATGNTPITAPVTNSTVNNAQSIVNNKSITLNNTFNVYDSKDSNTVIEQIKSYMNKTLRTAINSIK
jgi:TP901 family phage tail tape measure protein